MGHLSVMKRSYFHPPFSKTLSTHTFPDVFDRQNIQNSGFINLIHIQLNNTEIQIIQYNLLKHVENNKKNEQVGINRILKRDKLIVKTTL